MKLKRLELNGFKSFPEKTVVSFPKGISGVVGPNGCGKSNIVDAIKWVMGEQSPKQLRGKGMEDVIFAGSNGKQSVGMAEVSLILDNDNGSMPQEYRDNKEVVITRRLFRDGEGEYAINNKPCRLKDITHLFMDTGVGSKAYAVVEQGRIGAIIDSKPEDRRHWIEEAAGVSKYKSQKNETLRKLELTQQNLLRVGDVIAEIKRQMNSLYRQAKKAERYKEIRKQLKEVEVVLHAQEYMELIGEKGKKEAELQEQRTQVENLSQECQSCEDLLQQLQSRILEIERQLKEKQEYFYKQKSNLQGQEGLIQQYRRELETLADETLEIQKELKDIETWLKENGPIEKALKEEVDSFTQKVALEERRVREQEQSVTEAKKELTQAQEKGEQTKDLLVSKLSEMSRVRNMRAGLVKLREDRNRRIARQAEEKTQLIDRLNFLDNSIQEAENRLMEHRGFVNQQREEINKVQQQKTEGEKAQRQMEVELRDLEQAKKQDQAQIGNLQEIRHNFQDYKNGVRTLLQEEWLTEGSVGASFVQVFAEGLETEPGCEMAVEAALGDALQALIIQNPQEAIQGIHYLKDTGKGKATFLPKNPLPFSTTGSIPREEKGLVPLLSKVTIREEWQPWLNSLLGSFVLVSDLTLGLDIWKNYQGQVSVVTMDGDLIDSRGIMAGGSSTGPESGILYQKNLIHKLEEKVQKWQERIEQKKDVLQIKENELREKILQLEALEDQCRSEEKKILDLEKSLFGFQEEKKPLGRRLQLLSLEEEEYRSMEEDQTLEEQTLISQEEGINTEIETIKDEIQEKEEGIKTQETILEQGREALTQAYGRMSALKEKGGHIGREWERLKGSLVEKQGRQHRLLEKIQAGIQTRSSLEEKTAQGEAALKKLNQAVDALEMEIQTIDQTWEKLIKEKEGVDGDLKEKRGQMAEAERKENDLRIEMAQMVMKIDHLREQTLEQTGQLMEDVAKTYLRGDEDLEVLKGKRREFKDKLDEMGEVNLTALEEYNAFKERHGFYKTQEEDLLKSMDSLKRAIQKINSTSKDLFLSTFKVIQEKMDEVFPVLFGGGTAKLSLTDDEDPLEAGVEIMVHPPGKRLASMSLLSGGEKALTALALLFATYLVKPSPFCFLDEIDAFLDEANIERFKNLVQSIVKDSQIILITHNRRIMEMVDTLYGVTMEQPGISKLVSVRLETIQ